MSLIKKIFRIIWDSDHYLIYQYNSEVQGDGKDFGEIKSYNNLGLLPSKYESILFNGFFSFNMKRRLENSDTKILCYVENDELIGYGWLQDNKYFKRKFGWIKEGATMFGPYWVSPLHRGRGIYGELLQQSIFENGPKPAIIFTNPMNIASQKGINKEGFKKLGCFSITILFRLFLLKKIYIVLKT